MQSPLTISFKVASFQPIQCPFGRDRVPMPVSMNGIEMPQQTFVALCHVRDLPDCIPMDTNPRQQNLRTKVADQIRKGLVDNPSKTFHLLNRGLLISADTVQYNESTHTVSLTFSNPEKHGDVDGGHTYKIILEQRDLGIEPDQYVRIEIMTGIEEYFEDLAGARNTAIQVEDKALAQLAGKFQFLKVALGGTPFADEISYTQFDQKSIDVREIVAILSMFSAKLYKAADHPVVAYSSKAHCLKHFLDDTGDFEDLVPIAKDVFRLYDQIERRLPDFYRGENGRRYGGLKEIGYKDGKAAFTLRFSQERFPYETPNGFTYPMLAAFRSLVEVDPDSGHYRWNPAVSPFELLSNVGPDLAEATVSRSRSLGSNPQSVGKDSGHWAAMYDKVRARFLERLVEGRRTAARH